MLAAEPRGADAISAALSRVARGDVASLEFVYQRTSAKLFGVCLRILSDRQETEDVLQDVYLTVWRKAADFDPARASPITWLAAIARNRAIDRVRSSGFRLQRSAEPVEAADAMPDLTQGALDGMVDVEDQRRLANCIDQLQPREAGAIRRAFLDGLTYDELAKRDGIPLGTMKSLIRRALLRLRGCLS